MAESVDFKDIDAQYYTWNSDLSEAYLARRLVLAADRIEVGMAAENSWRVRQVDDGWLVWSSGPEDTWRREPEASWWRRFKSGLIASFAILATTASRNRLDSRTHGTATTSTATTTTATAVRRISSAPGWSFSPPTAGHFPPEPARRPGCPRPSP